MVQAATVTHGRSQGDDTRGRSRTDGRGGWQTGHRCRDCDQARWHGRASGKARSEPADAATRGRHDEADCPGTHSGWSRARPERNDCCARTGDDTASERR